MELRLLSKENQSANVVVSDALFNKDYKLIITFTFIYAKTYN